MLPFVPEQSILETFLSSLRHLGVIKSPSPPECVLLMQTVILFPNLYYHTSKGYINAALER